MKVADARILYEKQAFLFLTVALHFQNTLSESSMQFRNFLCNAFSLSIHQVNKVVTSITRIFSLSANKISVPSPIVHFDPALCDKMYAKN